LHLGQGGLQDVNETSTAISGGSREDESQKKKEEEEERLTSKPTVLPGQ